MRRRAAIIAALAAAACGPPPPAPAHQPPPITVASGDTLTAPDGSPLPDGALGVSIRRGYALLAHTGDSLPAHVGAGLRCTSCHLDGGLRADAIPFTGVYGRFPQYRSRSATVQRLEDRINDCFERSLAGKALAWDDPAMRDIVAYMAFRSKGILPGATLAGVGLPLGKATSGDTVAGAAVFARSCARCHGADGAGTPIAPPTWGARSFNIGAGMARLRSAAAFIQHNMPFDKAEVLSEQDAVNVAAYVVSRPRPDFAAKVNDWPHGDPPADVAYPTKAGRKAP